MKLKDLFATATSGADPIIVLERAMADLEITRDAAYAELARWPSAREQALRDGDAAELLRLRERRATLEDERDRADIALKETRAKLTEARQTRRGERWSFHRSEHGVAESIYLKAAQVALDAFAAIVAVRAAAINEGFAHEVQTLSLPPNINGSPLLAPDLMNAFIRKTPDTPPRRVRPIARKPLKVAPHFAEVQTGVRQDNVIAQPRERRPLMREVAGDGEVVISILRAGVEVNGKGPLAVGDEVAVATGQAADLLRSGAADFAQASPVTPPSITADQQVPA